MTESNTSVLAESLPHGATLDLGARHGAAKAQRALTAVFGRGRGCQLRTDGAACALWIPLRGRIQIVGEGDISLRSGEALVNEAQSRSQIVGRAESLWIGLLGRPSTWHRAMRELGYAATQAWLVPAKYCADRDLKRRALALARAIEEGDGHAVRPATESLIERLVSMQRGFSEAIARCPGRTYAQRRQVFVRLQRVYNHLSASSHADVRNEELARMANYSPSHFIRAFHAAYGETPHAFLIRRRLEHAQHLLHSSPLAINEIAIESGFENASAFARLFRQRFGMTAGMARRAGTPAIAGLL